MDAPGLPSLQFVAALRKRLHPYIRTFDARRTRCPRWVLLAGASIAYAHSKYLGWRGICRPRSDLGGTGSYALDLVAKTHVVEIHLFDADLLRPHNAFRFPGAISPGILDRGITKVKYVSETPRQCAGAPIRCIGL